jgi:SAM-dependent methyltransferase
MSDDHTRDLAGLTEHELQQLQWDEERRFARAILAAPKGSRQRAEIVRRAYDTVTKILARLDDTAGEGLVMGLVMGLDPRYTRLVLKLLAGATAGLSSSAGGNPGWSPNSLLDKPAVAPSDMQPSFFEIGYGCGAMLDEVAGCGYPIAGIEVSEAMRDQALGRLGPEHSDKLLLGSVTGEGCTAAEQYSLIYWNDVFEHIPPDEIPDYLHKIRQMLVPGGMLVTVTPNWHIRPADITAVMCPPRTEAQGLHLKEYTLREVTGLLRQAGFGRVDVPLFLTRRRIVLAGGGLAGAKRFFEPALEWLPFRLAEIACRGFGLPITIATK